MVFPFFEPRGWGKRSAAQPRTNESEVPQGSSDSFGKSWRREIFPQPKVQKTAEYCMYFPFFEPHGWGKRSAAQPKPNESEFP